MILELQPATREHGATIAEIYLESFDATLPDVRRARTDDECRAYFSTVVVDEHETWVAILDDDIVGFMALGDGWIHHLYLRLDATGKGVGTRLLELAKYRRSNGLSLHTFAVNTGARRFYERHGFVAGEFGDGSDNEEGAPDVRYDWRPVER